MAQMEKLDIIKTVCDKYGILIVEGAAESFVVTYKGIQTGVCTVWKALSPLMVKGYGNCWTRLFLRWY